MAADEPRKWDLDLVAYEVTDEPFAVRPAEAPRAWMDATDARFAYRCLPLTMANQLGWELLCPFSFSAIWEGGDAPEAIAIRHHGEESGGVVSHFGLGVLTFSPDLLFRTSAAHDLWVKGPTNRIKDGIVALEGLVETDWAPSTFTMNWKFTRPDCEVVFDAGEPIATIVPYPRGYAERFEPVLRTIAEEPELNREYRNWRDSREAFQLELQKKGTGTTWQKHYMQGRIEGRERRPDHVTKLDLAAFSRTGEE
jgi:hypothetical protein